MKKLYFYLFLFSTITFAQEYKYGKISEAEIKQQFHPKDTSAIAAVLYKNGFTKLGYDQGYFYEHAIETRIKIYKSEGTAYANVSIPMYLPGKKANEYVRELKGASYNLENNKVVRSKLKDNAQFIEEKDNDWVLLKFTIPDVKPGTVLEYSFKFYSPYIRSLPEFTFQGAIPYDNVTYEVGIPDFFGYKTFKKGFADIKIDSKRVRDKISVRIANNQTRLNSLAGGPESAFMEYDQIVTTYSTKELPKIEREPHLININNYVTSIGHEMEWEQIMNSTQVKKYSITWENVAEQLNKHKKFGEELQEKNYYEEELKPILAASSDAMDRINKVLEFAKIKVKWNGEKRVFVDEGVKNAYFNRTGNSAEINLMLISMLRHAGLNAQPVLLSTQENGIPVYPTITGFNYVICGVEFNKNEIILLDATNLYGGPNLLVDDLLNGHGTLIRNDNTTLQIDLVPKKISILNTSLDVKMLSHGQIEVKQRNIYTDHLALKNRTLYNSKNQEDYKKHLINGIGEIQLNEMQVDNKKDIEKPFIETLQYTRDYSYELIGDKIYFNPLFFLKTVENNFKAETRTYPIDFLFPRSRTIMAQVKIPEGYKIEYLPENRAHKLPNNLGDYSYAISTVEDNIQLRIVEEIKSSVFPAEFHGSLKEFYKLLIEKEIENIVLIKI